MNENRAIKVPCDDDLHYNEVLRTKHNAKHLHSGTCMPVKL